MIILGKIIDLTGQKFNKLTVIEKTNERRNRQVVWKCKCDCGNISYVVGQALRTGHTKSCGCLNYEKKDLDSLTNKKFGKLTVIKRSDYTFNNKVYWNCKCDCGKIIDVLGTDLRNNIIQSCSNCKENHPQNDLSQQRFGLLTAIEPTEKRQGSHIIWKCKCDCGTYCEVNSNSLKTGNTSSCGCLNHKSLGEEKINQFLLEKNINFSRQFIFNDCKSPKGFALIFDFVLFNTENQIIGLIEFDGIQHFKPIDFFGGENYFSYLKFCDEIKNNYCQTHSLPLLRIKYNEINQIEQLLKEFFINVDLR